LFRPDHLKAVWNIFAEFDSIFAKFIFLHPKNVFTLTKTCLSAKITAILEIFAAGLVIRKSDRIGPDKLDLRVEHWKVLMLTLESACSSNQNLARVKPPRRILFGFPEDSKRWNPD
jgi:hypothetical protein